MAARDEFKVHMLNDTGIARANQLAEGFSDLLDTVDRVARSTTLSGDSVDIRRELALVRTKLQEAAFWAKRAMALNPDNQK